MQIRDAQGNEYGRPRDVVGESRTVFTSHNDAHFDVCFENLITGCKLSPMPNPQTYQSMEGEPFSFVAHVC